MNRRGGLAAALLSIAAVCAPLPSTLAADALRIDVRSTDARRVTGGDALVEVLSTAPERGSLSVALNDVDISSAFVADATGRWLGLVGGLRVGRNRIDVREGAASEQIEVINHPITGPVFAGSKQHPFYCETSRFVLPDGSSLPAPLDADCSVKTVVQYVYKPRTGGAFKFAPDPSHVPKDVAFTTTSVGMRVPYVVRVETGTINRGIYQMAVLHDPMRESAPSVHEAPSAWNRRMVYLFGGGCGGMYRQGARVENVLNEQFVGLGYLTVSNSLNVFANNCDDLLAAETMMMTRERAIERVGVPLFVLGWGCSGGAHQVLLIADNYPGLLDGVMPLCNSVDFFRLGQHTTDIRLLYDWFATPAGRALSEEQKLAVTGTGLNADAGAAALYQANACPDIVPAADVLDPVTNPDGIRCGHSENAVNSLGRDPQTGLARSTLDNVGVQYGLQALASGAISMDQFLDLNEQIGGFDRNGLRQRERSVADEVGVAAAYRSGRVLNAGNGLKDIPIVELRNYSDADTPNTPGNRGMGATHLKYGTFVLMARLMREVGSRANQVVLLESHLHGFYSASTTGDEMSRFAIAKMDEWLTALAYDKSSDPKAVRMARTKPADLVDACFDPNGERIVEEQRFSGGRCNELYPTYPPPRVVAGGPMANDVLKCRLKAIDVADYPAPITASQRGRLERVFPGGVCDWSKPGVGQARPAGTWQSFR